MTVYVTLTAKFQLDSENEYWDFCQISLPALLKTIRDECGTVVELYAEKSRMVSIDPTTCKESPRY